MLEHNDCNYLTKKVEIGIEESKIRVTLIVVQRRASLQAGSYMIPYCRIMSVPHLLECRHSTSLFSNPPAFLRQLTMLRWDLS